MLPLVSIGVPVYNEGRFLTQSLEALLTQNYARCEIIISDNASTDETESIGRRFARQHDNVHYHRFKDNHGPASNFNYVLQQARGKYFMWAAGHDLWSENYIAACVDVLENDANGVLAVGSGQWIDREGAPLPRNSGWTDTRGMDVIARYFTVLWGNMHPILGLIKREELLACPMIQTVGSDLIMLTRLALRGDFLHAATATWSRREFRQEPTYNDKLSRYKSSDYGLAATVFSRVFPLARLPIELLRGVWTSRQRLWVKSALMVLLLPCLPVRYLAGRYKPQ